MEQEKREGKREADVDHEGTKRLSGTLVGSELTIPSIYGTVTNVICNILRLPFSCGDNLHFCDQLTGDIGPKDDET